MCLDYRRENGIRSSFISIRRMQLYDTLKYEVICGRILQRIKGFMIYQKAFLTIYFIFNQYLIPYTQIDGALDGNVF